MKGKNYKIVSLYSFFPFQENLILDLKNKLLEIENERELSGLLIFASEGINGTICAEKNVIDIVINLLNKYTCLLYTSPSPRDLVISRMPSSA